MEFAVIGSLFIGYLFLKLWLEERTKKKVSFVVHIQAQTEQSEHLDFAVTLFEDESEDKWQSKIYKAFEIMEKRRAFQFQRMQDLQKKFADENPAKENILALNKG